MLEEKIFLERKEMESRLKIRIGRNFGREKLWKLSEFSRSCCWVVILQSTSKVNCDLLHKHFCG